MNYEDNPDFNDYIDEQYGEINITDFFSRSASTILFEMDFEAYKGAFNEYDEEQRTLFPDKVCESFPAPIAFYYHQCLHDYGSENHRLNLLRTTWESLIFTLYGIVVGEIIFKNHNISGLGISFSDIFSDKLAIKLQIIEKILDGNLRNPQWNLTICDFLESNILTDLLELNRARNGISHIAALSEEQAKEKYEELSPKLFEILYKLRKLENISFILFNTISSPATNLSFSKFASSLQKKIHLIEVENTFITENIDFLIRGNLFCEYQDNQEIICLSPFIHIKTMHSQPCIIFFKKKYNASRWKFEIVGHHSEEIEIDSSQFTSLTNKIRSLT